MLSWMLRKLNMVAANRKLRGALREQESRTRRAEEKVGQLEDVNKAISKRSCEIQEKASLVANKIITVVRYATELEAALERVSPVLRRMEDAAATAQGSIATATRGMMAEVALQADSVNDIYDEHGRLVAFYGRPPFIPKEPMSAEEAEAAAIAVRDHYLAEEDTGKCCRDPQVQTIHTFLDRCATCGNETHYPNTHNYPKTHYNNVTGKWDERSD